MKKTFKIGLLSILLGAFAFTSCEGEGTVDDVFNPDDVIIDEDAGEDEFGNPIDTDGNSIAEIRLTEGGAADDKISTIIEGEAGGTVTGLVVFTSTTKQRRLYVTETLPGESAMPLVIPELSNRGTKADDSIDLDGDIQESIEFPFTLNVPNSIEDGSIIYNFWSTTGKGDFRDPTKRLLLGVASIEVRVGTGVNPDTPVRTYGNVTLQLDAPLQDGSSNTFMSIYDGQIYQLNQGEELAAFWDFGYYWIQSVGGPSLASTTNYFSLFLLDDGTFGGVADKTGISQSELNDFYIGTTTMDFDSVTLSSDLDALSTPLTQVVNGLEAGDVLAFEDQYGTKGLIRIVSISGTDGSTGNITFDVKAQAYAAFDSSDF